MNLKFSSQSYVREEARGCTVVGKNIKQQISNGLLTVKMSALRTFSTDLRQSFVALL